jgi:hypothetical protein
MMNLRKEYELSRLIKDDLQTEAAVEWLSANIVLLNEKMDRQGVSRLVQAVQRFDRKFGPFKEKLPAITEPLEAAEEGLRQVVSGDTNYARATDMFKHLMMTYNTLSNFFSADLPLLLRTPVFRTPSENPGVRLDSITGPGYDPKQIVKAFVKALRIAPEEVKLLGRVYRTLKMPSLDHKAIAQQLLSLSYDELKELTGAGRVPMAVTPDAQVEPAMGIPKEDPVLAEDNVLGEAISFETISKSLTSLGQIINGTELRSTSLAQAFKSLQSAFQQQLSSGKASQIWDQLAGGQTGQAPINPAQLWGTFRREKVLLEQIDYTINLFKKLGTIWPTLIKPAFSDGDLSQEDLNSLTAVITKQLKPGFFKSWVPGLAPKPFPGLAPADIARAISELTQAGPEAPVAAPPQPAAPAVAPLTEAPEIGDISAQNWTSAGKTGETTAPKANIASLESFFNKLNTVFTKQQGISAPTSGTGSAPADKAATTAPPASSTGSAPATETEPTKAPAAVGGTSTPASQVAEPTTVHLSRDPAEIAKILGKTDPSHDKQAIITAAVDNLSNAGYDIILQKKQPSPKK